MHPNPGTLVRHARCALTLHTHHHSRTQPTNPRQVVEGCDHAFHMAADMGGMGFIQSNHSVILYNNTMISYNFLEACRQAKVQR